MQRQSTRLHILTNELRAAQDFLELARMEFAEQHSKVADELIAEAEHNVDVAEHILKEMPQHFEQDQRRFSLKIAELRREIDETYSSRQVMSS